MVLALRGSFFPLRNLFTSPHNKKMNKLISLILLSALFVSSCTPTETPAPETPEEPNPPTNPQPPTNPDPGPNPEPGPTPTPSPYKPIGVGGGGALSGVAISPYSDLWFVGTDMGTLFRSTDFGASWIPVNHLEAVFDSDLDRATSPGFSSDGTTVFHASRGVNPKRSMDGGLTFKSIALSLRPNEYIKYWHSDTFANQNIYAATNLGLYVSKNKGSSWTLATGFSGESLGSFIDSETKIFYQAGPNGIWSSKDAGSSFTKIFTPSNSLKLRGFTGGRDSNGLTLSFSDTNGTKACSWTKQYADLGQNALNDTHANCGYLWVSKNGGSYIQTSQAVGDHIRMAENDSQTIYVTGSRKWIRQYGTKIFISSDAGQSFSLKLNQINWDVIPYAPWPSNKIEYSAVALDVGWWDDGYTSFEINRRNSKIAMGSGYFFVHSTFNTGDTWLSPLTEYKDTGTRTAGKKWLTRGLEVISVYRVKHHPTNTKLLYAASADIGGIISEDGGKSFRIGKAQYNSNYDYAFDARDDRKVYAASGNTHDWPNEWYANAMQSAGGIYLSGDRGKNWTRLTPSSGDLNRQFLSVGYDSVNEYIYGGTQQTGIVRSTDNGQTWNYFNSGLPSGNKIIPQIEVDPNSGDVYALLTGNSPEYTNSASTGIYYLKFGSSNWTLLRKTVNYPPAADKGYKLWIYPTSFAIDFNDPNTLWLTDYENNRNWLMTGVWKSSDRGQTWNRVKQLTHATSVTIDPSDTNRIYASGYYTLDGSWGEGGQFHSTNGGDTWVKNTLPPLQQNSRSAIADPNDPKKIIYTYFGGGMLHGPNPSY